MSECLMCSGEYCAAHCVSPCDCDTAYRHGGQPCGHVVDPAFAPMPATDVTDATEGWETSK